MIFRREKREVPSLNTTSTADISFMLLIFFLVVSSLDLEKGLMRQLPPYDKKEQEKTTDVKSEELMALVITADNKLTINGSPTDMRQLRQQLADFILRQRQQHLLTIEASPESYYGTYFQLQHEVVNAYRDARSRYASSHYHLPLVKLTEEQIEDIRQQFPQRIAESYDLRVDKVASKQVERKGGVR